jgi:hypothetical protein
MVDEKRRGKSLGESGRGTIGICLLIFMKFLRKAMENFIRVGSVPVNISNFAPPKYRIRAV